MYKFFSVVLLFVGHSLLSQEYRGEIAAWQEEINREFEDPEESPLTDKERKKFKGLNFFPIDSAYRVEAKVVRTPNEPPFTMPTTTDRKPVYSKYAEVHFVLKDTRLKLSLYQSHGLIQKEEYRDYLFLPFTDLTSGNESYGGGRYLDLKIPEGDSMIIDFNKAYNPYCAYNDSYSCPIPPAENDLQVAIRAGVTAWEK